MTNLLTLKSDKELLSVKAAVREEELIPFEQIVHYEKELNLERKHELFRELLILFDKFCRRNGIRYSLADGTLLGAFRHHQFIPWDDDADVMMTRNEYDKYLKALSRQDELVDFKLLFCHRASTEKMIRSGVLIDVFVIDDIPNNRVEWEIRKFVSRCLRIACFNRMSLINVKKKHGLKKVVLSIGFPVVLLIGKLERLILGKRIFDINERIARVKSNSLFCTKYTSNWRELNRVFKKEWFEGYSDIEMAGYNFMCIEGTEDYLVNMFGDWKSIPEKICREHDHVESLLDDKFINNWPRQNVR